MRAPVFKPLFFQVKPLPCGAAQKASLPAQLRPKRASAAIIFTSTKYAGGHPTRLNLSGTCMFAPHSEVRELEYLAKTSAPWGRTAPQPCTAWQRNEKTAKDQRPSAKSPRRKQPIDVAQGPTGARPHVGAHPPPRFPPKVRPGRHFEGAATRGPASWYWQRGVAGRGATFCPPRRLKRPLHPRKVARRFAGPGSNGARSCSSRAPKTTSR